MVLWGGVGSAWDRDCAAAPYSIKEVFMFLNDFVRFHIRKFPYVGT